MKVSVLVSWREEEVVSVALLAPGEEVTQFEEAVEVAGTEGKVLADRAPLQKALIEQEAGYRWCRWPDCGQTSMHGEETVPHAATCPLYREATNAS